MAQEFRVNQNLIDAIRNFNKLKPETADAVLQRIYQSPTSTYYELFTEKEREKLLKRCGFEDESEIKNIVKAFGFILIQAVAERNYAVVERTLVENGLGQQHAQVFAENWQKFSAELTLKMREKPVAIQHEMKDFNWSIQIPTQDSNLPLKNSASLKGPGERIDNNDELFSIDARNPSVVMNFQLQLGGDGKREDFSVRFTKAQIQTLFENMQILQDQLDNLA